MAQGIILAGGESSRAKTNKLLLKVSNKELIRHAIDSIKPFVSKVIVVTGKYHDQLLPFLQDVEVVRNFNYGRGMFSSVQTGVAVVDDDFFILPGDNPFVSGSTYEKLLKEKGEVLRPICKGKTGHPVLISRNLKEKLLEENVSSNLRDFISKFDVKDVEVDDLFIDQDVDTIAEYEEIVTRIERN